MKAIFAKPVLASLLLISAGAALAEAPSADLKVTGTIAVPGCTVAQSGNGVYDYGSIDPSQIQPATTTNLTDQTQTWTVTCDAETYLAFQVIDNQTASTSGTPYYQFGLGNINGNGKIGYYTVALSNPLVDNVASYLYQTTSTSISGSSSLNLYTGYTNGWAATSGNYAAQKAGQTFAVDMKVTPTLASTTTMGGPVTDRVPLDGSLTINYSFGL